MASAIFTFVTVFIVSASGSVDCAHMQCNTDHECPDGFFCYDESRYCTRCVDCDTYKRKSSWRSCPKTPSDCGACVSGHEEEIFHEGKTRDMCIPSAPSNSLSHVTVSDYSPERYILAILGTVIILPFAYYVFCKMRWNLFRDRGSNHHGLPHEEPPPYRSIELTTLTSNDSVERLSEEDHVLSVGQQKDCLVQAVPFRQADYVESEVAFDNAQEANSEESVIEERVVSDPDLHDENTMPSNWTPESENGRNNQLMIFESPASGTEISSEPEDDCEPASKRHKTSNSQEEQPSNSHLNINLFIHNKFTIHKP